MRTLSGYMFRVTLIAGVATLAIAFAVSYVVDIVTYKDFLAGLDPDIRQQLQSESGPLSQSAANALNAFYTSWWQQWLMPISVGLGLIVGGLIGAVHSRRLLRPLDMLAGAANRLAAGEASVRVPPTRGGIAEIDEFTKNFNAMADAIQRSERNLRESNAAIAHELRTPLTVLIGRINGMIDGVFPTDQDALAQLLVQTAQLQRIIEDLNLLTLAEAGRFRINTEPTDLARIVKTMLARGAETAMGVTDDKIEYDLQPAPARADAERIRQVLSALLENARRYAGEGLRVETGNRDGTAFLSVADRGAGLTPEQAARVFDRFWRADTSRSKAAGGSGLGLSVARSIVEAHGGKLRYADRPGGGAVLTLTLPALRAGAA